MTVYTITASVPPEAPMIRFIDGMVEHHGDAARVNTSSIGVPGVGAQRMPSGTNRPGKSSHAPMAHSVVSDAPVYPLHFAPMVIPTPWQTWCDEPGSHRCNADDSHNANTRQPGALVLEE